ncbi:uncharacterized protein LOC144179587 [Haemaphysalis longicornis]
MARPRPREASMTAPSGSCVLYCGFSKIQSPEKYFKGSCFRRGIKLYASNHVYGVKEEILSETAPSEIVARCIPQMKSTCDYDVRLELSPNPRRIVRGRCSCKAGCRGWCKHAAAVAVFINSHEEKSCTELPRAYATDPGHEETDKGTLCKWHQERKHRITSTMAHRIKTRRTEFEALAAALASPRPFWAQATTYGRNTEAEARRELSKETPNALVYLARRTALIQRSLRSSSYGFHGKE